VNRKGGTNIQSIKINPTGKRVDTKDKTAERREIERKREELETPEKLHSTRRVITYKKKNESIDR